MESSYGVGVVNRYALFLDDESDPLDAIKAQEQAKEQKKKAKEAEKENKGKPEAKPKSVTAQPRKGIKETQNVKSQDIKGIEQKGKPGARPNERNNERPPPRRREDRPQNGPSDVKEGGPRPPRRENTERDRDRERKPYDRRPEGEAGDRRGPRGPPRDRDRERERDGPRPPRNFENRGKREFDRRSGSDKTGVKPIDKREGGGAHNWGTHKDEIEDLNKTGSEGSGTEERPEGGAPVVAGTADIPAEGDKPKEPEPEEPRELTLDEYKALKNAARAKPQYNLRKAGEGEDLTQWKNMVVLEKKKEGEGEEGDTDDEYDMADYPQRVGRQKRVLGIEFTFNDSARRGGGGRGRGRGGRGGRGGVGGPGRPREEREREDDRQPSRYAAPPKVDDSKDFPSLG